MFLERFGDVFGAARIQALLALAPEGVAGEGDDGRRRSCSRPSFPPFRKNVWRSGSVSAPGDLAHCGQSPDFASQRHSCFPGPSRFDGEVVPIDNSHLILRPDSSFQICPSFTQGGSWFLVPHSSRCSRIFLTIGPHRETPRPWRSRRTMYFARLSLPYCFSGRCRFFLTILFPPANAFSYV